MSRNLTGPVRVGRCKRAGGPKQPNCSSSQVSIARRGGPDPTLGSRDPDLFGHLGSGRWDPDLLDDDPDLEKEPDPNEDPDLFLDLVS